MVSVVRRYFIDAVRRTPFPFDGSDVERVMKDDKWVERCLLWADGKTQEAVERLLRFCQFRKLNDVNKALDGESLEKYYKIIKENGKDKKGNPLLIINVHEMELFCDLGSGNSVLVELIIRWFEDLDSRKDVTGIAIAFYHGAGRCMENLAAFLAAINDISKVYCGFVKMFYIFDDVISFDSRRKIEFLTLFTNAPMMYVNQKNCLANMNFDLPLYEIEVNKAKDGSAAENPQAKQDDTNSGAVPKKTNSKKKKKNKNSGNVQSSVANGGDEAETQGPEVAERSSSESSDVEQKVAVKDVLKRLHSLQSEVNNIIKDVMNLL